MSDKAIWLDIARVCGRTFMSRRRAKIQNKSEIIDLLYTTPILENRQLLCMHSSKSLLLVVIVKALSGFLRLTKNYDAVTRFWSKPSSFLISHHSATKQYLNSTSNLFPRFLPMTSHIDRSPCLQMSLDSVRSCTYHVYSFDIAIWDTRLFTCTCATWILATASIRERGLFCSARPEVWWQFENSD